MLVMVGKGDWAVTIKPFYEAAGFRVFDEYDGVSREEAEEVARAAPVGAHWYFVRRCSEVSGVERVSREEMEAYNEGNDERVRAWNKCKFRVYDAECARKDPGQLTGILSSLFC